jgi:16S rRNA (guanine966-N2)-methyltransferase
VLDAFGGAGTMSIEFRSRGAASVLAFEKDPSAHAAIEKSFLAFNDPEGLVVKKTDVIKFLRAGPDGDAQPFDLVVLDPPYQSDLGQQALALLVEQSWLAKGAVVLLECDTRKEEPISHSGLAIRSSRRYGDTTLYIFDYCG